MCCQSASVSVSFCWLSGFDGIDLQELVRDATDVRVEDEARLVRWAPGCRCDRGCPGSVSDAVG